MSRLDFTEDDGCFVGQDLPLRFSVVDDDGVVVPITSWTFEFVLTEEPSGSVHLIWKSSASGITIISGSQGILEVAIADTDTVGMKPRTYWYMLRRADAGYERDLFDGYMVMQAAASR